MKVALSTLSLNQNKEYYEYISVTVCLYCQMQNKHQNCIIALLILILDCKIVFFHILWNHVHTWIPIFVVWRKIAFSWILNSWMIALNKIIYMVTNVCWFLNSWFDSNIGIRRIKWIHSNKSCPYAHCSRLTITFAIKVVNPSNTIVACINITWFDER